MSLTRYAPAVLLLLTGAPAWAVEESSFQSLTTAQLVDTCSARPGDPRAVEAAHYCAGYVTGAFATYLALRDPKAPPDYCNLPQSRHEGILRFVEWARSRPELRNQKPADSLFQFLDLTYACAPGAAPLGR